MEIEIEKMRTIVSKEIETRKTKPVNNKKMQVNNKKTLENINNVGSKKELNDFEKADLDLFAKKNDICTKRSKKEIVNVIWDFISNESESESESEYSDSEYSESDSESEYSE